MAAMFLEIRLGSLGSKAMLWCIPMLSFILVSSICLINGRKWLYVFMALTSCTAHLDDFFIKFYLPPEINDNIYQKEPIITISVSKYSTIASRSFEFILHYK
jgi:hypothetical protein